MAWLVTGAARGLGLEIARAALAEGHAVIATARDEERVAEALADAPADRLLAARLDVGDRVGAEAVVAAGELRFGSIDVLVNNAGFGLLGTVEEVSDAEARAIFDTNVFGLLTVTRAVLPGMRRRGSGRILNIGSMAGFDVSASWALYAASKFAVEAISDGLRLELAPLGIHATVVEPGLLRTDFLDDSSLRRAERTIEDYGMAGVRDWADANNRAQPGDPVKAARAIVALATIAEPPARLPLGDDAIACIEGKLERVAGELERWRPLADVALDD